MLKSLSDNPIYARLTLRRSFPSLRLTAVLGLSLLAASLLIQIVVPPVFAAAIASWKSDGVMASTVNRWTGPLNWLILLSMFIPFISLFVTSIGAAELVAAYTRSE